MRLLILLLLITAAANAQITRFYNPGQNIPIADNVGLVLKHNGKEAKGIDDLQKYANVKILKLLSFNSPDTRLDSSLRLIARQMQPHTIIFEDCDLNDLNIFLDIFPHLNVVSVTKHSAYFENSLFTYLSKIRSKNYRCRPKMKNLSQIVCIC